MVAVRWGEILRASFIVVALAAGGCDGAYTACEGLLGECDEAFTPDEGAWKGIPEGWSDACAEPLWTGSDWTLDGTGAAFALTPVDADPADCERDGRAFTCAAARPDGVSVTHEGEFLAGSEAVAAVTLTSTGCTATGDVLLLAGWRMVGDNAEGGNLFQEWLGNLFGGDGSNGYVPGGCPRDYDDHEQAACAAEEEREVTVENHTDDSLSLLQSGDFYESIPAQGVLTMPMCVGSIYAIGTGWEEEECLWSFQVDADTSTVVYPPP